MPQKHWGALSYLGFAKDHFKPTDLDRIWPIGLSLKGQAQASLTIDLEQGHLHHLIGQSLDEPSVV